MGRKRRISNSDSAAILAMVPRNSDRARALDALVSVLQCVLYLGNTFRFIISKTHLIVGNNRITLKPCTLLHLVHGELICHGMMMVRYGFNVDRAYCEGLRVGCQSTHESILKTSCNANLNAGDWSRILSPFESSQAPAAPPVCGSASALGKAGDFIMQSILLDG